MRCPKCGCEESKVVDSRPSENMSAIRRRRECIGCGMRFTTYERREELPLVILKKDGSMETFDRQKLMRGLVRATVKRGIDIQQLSSIIASIENDLRDRGISELRSTELGDMVLARLRDLDQVAYIRFASVYKDFKDFDDFAKELRSFSS